MNAPLPNRHHLPAAAIALLLANFLPQPSHASQPHGFGPVQHFADATQLSAQINAVGDFNGDGLDDFVSFWRSSFATSLVGDVYVNLTTPSGLAARTKWHDFFSINDELPLTGDFNGDGKDDIISFLRGTSGDVYVALSNGSSFGPGQLWHGSFCVGTELPVVADINGDGKDDILTFTRSGSPRVFAALSTGSGFAGTGTLWHSNFCPPGAVPFAGDVDGDGKDDIIAFYRSSQSGQAQGDVVVALSTGTTFGSAYKWHEWFSIGDETPLVGDFDADGRADIATCTHGTGADVYVALSTSTEFRSTSGLWHTGFADGTTKRPMVGRFNPDLNSDLMSFRDTSGPGPIEVALAGGHAVPRVPEIGERGYATMGVPEALPPLATRPPLVQIPLLVVIVEIPGKPPFSNWGRDRDFFDQMVFGPDYPNIRDYFLEMSGGKFTFSRYSVIGPIQIDPADTPDDDIASVIKQELADRGIDFRPFDTDGNGVVETPELAIAMIHNRSPGISSTSLTRELVTYANGAIQVDCKLSVAGSDGNINFYAHELFHILGTEDLNSSRDYVGGASPMQHENLIWGIPLLVHLDPFHKMRLGWITPPTYDLRYPGGTLVDIAQTAGLPGRFPPVLLSDPTRDPREFYMLDYRSPYWGSAGSTPHYDAQARRSVSGGPGFGLWYFNTDSSHQLIRRRATIGSGKNRTLESSRAPGSDDIESTIHIAPGPDSILQSTPSGDDIYIDDVMAFPGTTPGDYSSRGDYNRLDRSSGIVSPEWYDRSPVGGGLQLRFQEGSAASQTGFVQWGNEFVPFLTLTSAPVATAGTALAVAGTLGIREPGTMIPAIVSLDHAYDLPVTQWTVAAAALEIPTFARPGDYRLVIYTDETRQLASNSLPITIENLYFAWVGTTMPDILDSDLALPLADADADGWSNIAEYLLDSDPLDPGEPQLTVTHLSEGGSTVQWTEIAARNDAVSARAQISTDLLTWTDQTSSVVAQSGPRITRAIVVPETSHRYFIRLVFEAAD